MLLKTDFGLCSASHDPTSLHFSLFTIILISELEVVARVNESTLSDVIVMNVKVYGNINTNIGSGSLETLYRSGELGKLICPRGFARVILELKVCVNPGHNLSLYQISFKSVLPLRRL